MQRSGVCSSLGLEGAVVKLLTPKMQSETSPKNTNSWTASKYQLEVHQLKAAS